MVFIQAFRIVANPFYFASDARTTTACPVGSRQGRSGREEKNSSTACQLRRIGRRERRTFLT